MSLEIDFQRFANIYIFLIHFSVTALREIKRSLTDPMRNLSNWEKGDPCNSNWTGITCFERSHDDGHLHVRELYVSLVLTFVYSSSFVSFLVLLIE